MEIGKIGEFGLINQVTRGMIFNKDEVVIGIGDDCAVLPYSETEYLLLTCDMMMENVHFLKDQITPYQLGYKVVAINLSDIAAMGGIPNSILISIGLPKNTSVEYCEEIYRGIKAICQAYQVNVIGGDTVSTKEEIAINVTAVGRVKKEDLHLRSMANQGQYVFLTGPVGDSHGGLKLILDSKIKCPTEIREKLLNTHYLPEPCCKEVMGLTSKLGVRALNDISDGVASEAWEISEASGTGIIIDRDRIPVSEEVRQLANVLGEDPVEWALFGGEDYQLIGTVDQEYWEELSQQFLQQYGKPLYRIGEVAPEYQGVYIRSGAEIISLGKKGFNHFGEIK